MKYLPVFLVLLAGVNSCIGNVLLKYSRIYSPEHDSLLERYLTPAFAGGLFFYGVNVLLFAKALDDIDVSIAYPILAGSGFVFLAILSSYLFGEIITPSKLMGMLMIFLGVIAVSYKG